MHREGHLGIAFIGYSPVVFALSYLGYPELAIIGMVGLSFAVFVPDFDLWLPGVKHRGMTHTWIAGVVLGLIYVLAMLFYFVQYTGSPVGVLGTTSLISAYLVAIPFAFFVGFYGVVLHLIGDVITPMGVRPHQPWSDQAYTFDMVYAADKGANEQLMEAGGLLFIASIVVGTLMANGSLGRILRLFQTIS